MIHSRNWSKVAYGALFSGWKV